MIQTRSFFYFCLFMDVNLKKTVQNSSHLPFAVKNHRIYPGYIKRDLFFFCGFLNLYKNRWDVQSSATSLSIHSVIYGKLNPDSNFVNFASLRVRRLIVPLFMMHILHLEKEKRFDKRKFVIILQNTRFKNLHLHFSFLRSNQIFAGLSWKSLNWFFRSFATETNYCDLKISYSRVCKLHTERE